MRSVLIVLVACGGGAVSPTPVANPPSSQDKCTVAVDKLAPVLAREFKKTLLPEERKEAIEECHKGNPEAVGVVDCIVKADSDPEIIACLEDDRPKKRLTEPHQDLDKLVDNLRVYHISHEVLLEGNAALTPAQECCKYPDGKCPAGSWSGDPWKLLNFDDTKARVFQYRFEGTRKKVVIEAIADRDCDGIPIKFRRELELRDDGKLHITVDDGKQTDD